MIVEEGKYFLYRHIRPDKNEPFYIGVGSKRKRGRTYKTIYERAFTTYDRNSIWKRIRNKSGYEIEIILESDNYNFVLQKEKEFISLYGRICMKTGCLSNLTEGGEGTKNVPIEVREKISKGLKGIIRSEETKNKIREARAKQILIPRTKESKEAMSIKRMGTGNPMFGIKYINNKHSKPIKQFTINGDFIKDWSSAREAHDRMGFCYKLISACCTNNQKSACGFIWKFK